MVRKRSSPWIATLNEVSWAKQFIQTTQNYKVQTEFLKKSNGKCRRQRQIKFGNKFSNHGYIILKIKLKIIWTKILGNKKWLYGESRIINFMWAINNVFLKIWQIKIHKWILNW